MRSRLAAVAVVLLAACSSTAKISASTTSVAPTSTSSPSTSASSVATTAAPTTAPTTTAPAPPDTLPAAEPSDPPVSTVATSTIAPTAPQVAAPTTSPATTVTPPSLPTGTPYGMPVEDFTHASYAHVHHDYPASDIFVRCGAIIVAPVNGTVLEARRVDSWTKADNPATRGGKSIAILGDDGVRYYFAHLNSIDTPIEPGVRVAIGDHIGVMGKTGKASACHLHFAISPPCPGKEWAVRRGVIWPWPYLDAWRKGIQTSPVAEITKWVAAHPTACADAMADPNAGDS